MITPNLSRAPKGATHWAADSGEFVESWYRYDGSNWYCINDYWSDEVEVTNSRSHHKWYYEPQKLNRPVTDLISLESLKMELEIQVNNVPVVMSLEYRTIDQSKLLKGSRPLGEYYSIEELNKAINKYSKECPTGYELYFDFQDKD